MQDVWMGLIKPFVLGFVIVTIACHVGLRTKGGTAGRRQGDDGGGGRRIGGGDRGRLLRDPDSDRADVLTMDTDSNDARRRRRSSANRARRSSCSIRCSSRSTRRSCCKNISFTLIYGHTKIILGASGSGKSTTLKIITGLLRADAGVVWVNGERVDQLTEREMMAVRADLGMIFQEGRAVRLADRARERRLQALRRERHAARGGRQAGRGSARLGRPERVHRPHAVGAVGRPAAPRRDRAGDGVQAAHPALRRGDHRARSDHGDDRRRGDHQAARPRARQLDRRHAPAARRVLRRDAHGRARRRRQGARSCRRRPRRSARPSSSCSATA